MYRGGIRNSFWSYVRTLIQDVCVENKYRLGHGMRHRAPIFIIRFACFRMSAKKNWYFHYQSDSFNSRLAFSMLSKAMGAKWPTLSLALNPNQQAATSKASAVAPPAMLHILAAAVYCLPINHRPRAPRHYNGAQDTSSFSTNVNYCPSVSHCCRNV